MNIITKRNGARVRVRNSASSSSTVNATLSNFASSVAPDLGARLAGFIAPQVPTGLSSGQYVAFNTADAFKVYATRRALGGQRNRIEFNKTDPYFNCKANGLEIAIDDKERRNAGDRILNLEQAKTRTLMSNIGVAHEKAVFDLVGAVTAEEGLGKWTDASVDPIDELDQVIEKIAKQTGIMPNRGVISLSGLRRARQNKLLRARFPGKDMVSVGVADIARLTINPNIELRVGVLPYDSSKPGGTETKKFIGADDVFIFIGSDTADTMDPSWAKTFAVLPLNEANIIQYRDERCASDVLANDWDIDIVVTSSISGARIALS